MKKRILTGATATATMIVLLGASPVLGQSASTAGHGTHTEVKADSSSSKATTIAIASRSQRDLKEFKAELDGLVTSLVGKLRDNERALLAKEQELGEREHVLAAQVSEFAITQQEFAKQRNLSWLVFVLGILGIMLGIVVGRKRESATDTGSAEATAATTPEPDAPAEEKAEAADEVAEAETESAEATAETAVASEASADEDSEAETEEAESKEDEAVAAESTASDKPALNGHAVAADGDASEKRA